MIMTNNGSTLVEEVIINHMREGYYIINNELKITNDHPIFINNYIWKRAEDLVIGNFVNGVRINTIKYVSKRIPTVSIVTSSDSYNVYCDNNMYAVHGRYKLFIKQAA